MSKFKSVIQLISQGKIQILFDELRKRLWSQSISLGLQRDLSIHVETPEAKIKINVRPLKNEDIEDLLDLSAQHTIDPRIVSNQMGMLKANIPTCYVAETTNGRPVYMQWLIQQKEDKNMRAYLHDSFPKINESEALLEGAYTHPAYRGLQIMPRAMSILCEKAAQLDVKRINTFVTITNIPSLRGCKRAGFYPYMIRKDRWLFFKRFISFHPVTVSICNHFDVITKTEGASRTGAKKPKSVPVHPVKNAVPVNNSA
jgi:hypothetical protein